MRILKARNPFKDDYWRTRVRDDLVKKAPDDVSPSEFHILRRDDDGQPWSAWGDGRRAYFWSGASLPATAACMLEGKLFSEVVTANGLLRAFADWFISKADWHGEAGLLLTCRYRRPEWR